MTESELENSFPQALAYLQDNRDQLSAREGGRFKSNNWYAFGYPKSMTLFQKPKIVVPDYDKAPSYTFDSKEHFYKTGYGVILHDNEPLSLHYVLGILASPLLFQYLISVGTSLRGGFYRFWTQYIEQLPIRTIDFSDPEDAARHEKMVGLVGRMLALHERLAQARIERERTVIGHQISAADRQIDNLVYELYGLTDEEIKIVEGATAR